MCKWARGRPRPRWLLLRWMHALLGQERVLCWLAERDRARGRGAYAAVVGTHASRSRPRTTHATRPPAAARVQRVGVHGALMLRLAGACAGWGRLPAANCCRRRPPPAQAWSGGRTWRSCCGSWRAAPCPRRTWGTLWTGRSRKQVRQGAGDKWSRGCRAGGRGEAPAQKHGPQQHGAAACAPAAQSGVQQSQQGLGAWAGCTCTNCTSSSSI